MTLCPLLEQGLSLEFRGRLPTAFPNQLQPPPPPIGAKDSTGQTGKQITNT